MAIVYSTACALKKALLEHHSLSDVHDLPSFDLAQRVIHEAGLATAIIPLVSAKKAWSLHLAVVDPGEQELRLLPSGGRAAECVYALIQLFPMSDFVSELTTCDLSRPWWAAPLTFTTLADLIAPHWKDHCTYRGGRSHWGDQRRTAFAKAFEEYWPDPKANSSPGTGCFSLQPSLEIPAHWLRFFVIPRTSSLLVPALAGATA